MKVVVAIPYIECLNGKPVEGGLPRLRVSLMPSFAVQDSQMCRSQRDYPFRPVRQKGEDGKTPRAVKLVAYLDDLSFEKLLRSRRKGILGHDLSDFRNPTYEILMESDFSDLNDVELLSYAENVG